MQKKIRAQTTHGEALPWMGRDDEGNTEHMAPESAEF